MTTTSVSAASRWFIPLLSITLTFCISNAEAQSRAWPTHSHDEQHSGVSSVASQPLTKIHWKTPVDRAVPAGEIFIHYGSPLVTAANTVIVPVKTGADNFRVVAHSGATGKILWRLGTGYQAPFAGFLPGMGPTLVGNRLIVPDSGGRLIVRSNVNQASGALSRLYFYGQNNFQANPTAYEQSVQINTPLTA